MELLHIYSNGSKLFRTTIRKILDVPIWKGNRILDHTHVNQIRNMLESTGTSVESLDSGYHIVEYDEEDAVGQLCSVRYLIDGQHRYEVIKQMIEPCTDFKVTCVIKKVQSESEVIDYFNTINHAKPIQFEEEPSVIINRFLAGIQKVFTKKLIRTGKTVRPYISINDLRDELTKHIASLRRLKVERFLENIQKENLNILRILELELATIENLKDKKIKESAVEHKFALGVVKGFPWILKCCF